MEEPHYSWARVEVQASQLGLCFMDGHVFCLLHLVFPVGSDCSRVAIAKNFLDLQAAPFLVL